MLHNCPICGRPTTGTPKEGGITWDICPDCDARQKPQNNGSKNHRGETKSQHSAVTGAASF